MPNDKVLILGPSWVGDMVIAHSLFQILKQMQPEIQIDVAAPAWTLPLLDRMPEVSEKIALPFQHGKLDLMSRIRLGKQLKARQYQQSISLVNSFKSAILPFAAGIPKRTGFLGEMRYGLLNDIRPLNKQQLAKTVDRFVALGLDDGQPMPQAIPQPLLYADQANGQHALNKLGISLGNKVLGLCPGAEYGEAKRWPSEYYATVANAMLDKGWQIILFGSDKDKTITHDIDTKTNNHCIDLGGRTALGNAIDIMSLCQTVISNDSGLMHIAAALDKQLIAIFGSSDPSHTPPMHPQAMIEYLGLPCSPCFKRTCPLGHLNCLKQIQPEAILNRLQYD